MVDKHTAESQQMIKVGVGFGVLAVVIAVATVAVTTLWEDKFYTAITFVSAGLAFFFSAGLAVWCLPPAEEAKKEVKEAEEAKQKAGEAKREAEEAKQKAGEAKREAEAAKREAGEAKQGAEAGQGGS